MTITTNSNSNNDNTCEEFNSKRSYIHFCNFGEKRNC